MFERDRERIRGAEAKSEFIALLYRGENVLEACAEMRLNPAVIGLERRDDVDFDADIRAAQAFRIDLSVDRLENIQDHIPDAMMASVVSKNLQWLASKRLRQVYGDKLDVSHTHTINISAAMLEARQRVLSVDSGNMLMNNNYATDTTSDELPPIDAELVEIDPLS